MKTNKMGYFICGVLAAYGLVVACGNMDSKEVTKKKNDDDNSCLRKLFDCNKKNVPVETVKIVVE